MKPIGVRHEHVRARAAEIVQLDLDTVRGCDFHCLVTALPDEIDSTSTHELGDGEFYGRLCDVRQGGPIVLVFSFTATASEWKINERRTMSS
jgi:hypothetical protein